VDAHRGTAPPWGNKPQFVASDNQEFIRQVSGCIAHKRLARVLSNVNLFYFALIFSGACYVATTNFFP
jgi:hypothetical protein